MARANILIVEDIPSKQAAIESALASVESNSHAVRSITDAFRLVSEQRWDLIILDMTFQVDRSAGFESGRQATAGIELLQFMARRRLRTPVIVATQHVSFSSPEIGEIDGIAALDELLTEAFPHIYRGTVKVDQSEGSWKLELLNAAKAILESETE